MGQEILPVRCPKCGECQNAVPGGFDDSGEPVGPVACMVCGHAFEAEEYRRGVAERTIELEKLGRLRPPQSIE